MFIVILTGIRKHIGFFVGAELATLSIAEVSGDQAKAEATVLS